jgi:multiple sugar transport system permease protein
MTLPIRSSTLPFRAALPLRVTLPFRAFARHGVLAISTIVVATPFVWMVLLSLMPPERAGQGAVSLVFDLAAIKANYSAAMTETPMPRFLLNGVMICAATLSCQILVGAPLAFALAKTTFPGRGIVIGLVLVAVMLPHEILAVPLFFLCYRLGILDSYAAMILPNAISPTAVFLMYQFFRTIPDDLIHAARIDGMSHWSIVWRVMVPLSRPVLAAIAVLSLVGRWNDLYWPAIAVTSQELMPPPLGILVFRDEEAGTSYGPLMAAAVITTAPLVAAFLVAQRRFIESFTASGVR